MLLLVGEEKYKIVFGGVQMAFWMRNSKTCYRINSQSSRKWPLEV